MVLLDANFILRYLLNDDKDMYEQAKENIEGGNAFVTIEIVAEIVYVLKGVYSVKREEIAESMIGVLKLIGCPDADVLTEGLELYGKTNLDFPDCILCAYHTVRGYTIKSFDKKLNKLLAETDTVSDEEELKN